MSSRPRIAMVTSDASLCGVGQYARALAAALAERAEIIPLGLDPTIMRGRSRAAGDALVGSHAGTMARLDAACLQIEWGILGRSPGLARQRLGRLLDAAPAASLALHTVFRDRGPDWAALGRKLLRRPGAAIVAAATHFDERLLAAPVYRDLARRQKRQRLGVVVHAPGDAAMLRRDFGLDPVFDHPLMFLTPAQILRLRALPPHPVRDLLPVGAHLSSVFGFIGEYKGIDVALAALRELPDRHHLGIFGGMHPNRIGAAQDPLIASLIAQCDEGLRRRVHFLGAQSDEMFHRGMLSSEAVLVPYREIGYSASGPASLAIELGCRVIASRTRAAMELAHYFPERLELFDIGNFRELATRLALSRTAPIGIAPAYSLASGAAIHMRAMGFDGA